MVFGLEIEDPDCSLERIGALYSKVGFNDVASFGLLRTYVAGHPEFVQLVIYRDLADYIGLNKAIRHFFKLVRRHYLEPQDKNQKRL